MEQTEAKPKPPRYFWVGIVVILAAGFALRVWDLGHTSLWADEAWADRIAKLSFTETLNEVSGSIQAPLHVGLLTLLPITNELLLRFPSLLFGWLAIPLFMRLTYHLYHRYDLALLAGALLACNPFHIWYSRMARLYALVVLLTLLVSYYFVRLINGQRQRVIWAGFIIASSLLYQAHYFSLLLAGAQYVFFFFILRDSRAFYRQWVGAQFLAMIPLVLFWLEPVIAQKGIKAGISWIPLPNIADLGLTFWNMTIGYTGSLPWYQVPGLLAAVIGGGLGLYWALRGFRSDRVNFYWFWTVVVAVGLTFSASFFFTPMYVDRYLVIILPSVLLLILYGWSRLPGRTWLAALGAVVILTGLGDVLTSLHTQDHQREDWRGAAAFVEQAYQPGDGLIIETDYAFMAFLRYFDLGAALGDQVLGVRDETENFDLTAPRIWLVQRNPNDNVHLEGKMPDFDPFDRETLRSAAWLQTQRDQQRITAQAEFSGVAVFLIEQRGPANRAEE